MAAYTGAPLSGVGAAYYVAAAAYLMFGVLLLPVHVPVIERTRGGHFIRTILGGLSFVWTRKLFRSLIGLNYLDIFFLASHTALLPVFADVVFRGDGSTLGSLYMVSGIGSLLGALVAANLGYFPKRGWLIPLGAGIQAFFLTLFGFSSIYAVAVCVLLMAGIGLSIFMVGTQHLGADPRARRVPRPGHGHLGHELQRRPPLRATADGRRRRLVLGSPGAVPRRLGRRAVGGHPGRGGHGGCQPDGARLGSARVSGMNGSRSVFLLGRKTSRRWCLVLHCVRRRSHVKDSFRRREAILKDE